MFSSESSTSKPTVGSAPTRGWGPRYDLFDWLAVSQEAVYWVLAEDAVTSGS